MTMENIADIDVMNLIPQRPPVVMVDRLLRADEQSAVSVFEIRHDSFMVENGALLPAALIENIAQTCAAQLGYIDRCTSPDSNVRIGFVGAVKDLKILKPARVGDILTTETRIIEQIGDMKLIAASVECNGDCIATSEMKIALSQIETAL